MTEQFENLVKEVINKGILITEATMVGDSIAFGVDGFSKSGIALIYEKDGKIYSKTSYETIDEITSFKDLARIAFEWNHNYIEREPFTQYDSNWRPYFEEYGWL